MSATDTNHVVATVDDGPAEALPSWFVIALVGALTALVALGTIGLVLADAGSFTPLPTLALALVVGVVLFRKIAPWRIPTREDRAAQVPAALAVALSAVATAFAMSHHAEHVLVDRDPGAYMVTARWLATRGNLDFNARLGAFRQIRTLFYNSPAMYVHGSGHLTFQFSHLLPVLLAPARWIGGDSLMFLVPPIIGGLGLVCFYALSTRFVRPWIALAATTALAADLVEVHFMRDAYSELPTQVVLLGGLWLLTRKGTPRPAVSAFTGLLLGATVMARIDGPLYLIAVPFALGAGVMAYRREDPDGNARLVAARWLVAGVALTTVIGYLDVSLRSAQYVASLGNRVPLQYAALGAGCLIAIGLAFRAPRLGSWPARAAGGRLPVAGGIVVALGLFAMWFVRPHLQQTTVAFRRFTPEVMAQERFYGVVAAGVRTHFERTLIWQSWYIGPVLLAVGILGVALLTRDVLAGSRGSAGLVVVTFLPVAAVYFWNPNVFSDQIWVMRRYLPLIIPCLILFAFVLIQLLLDLRRPGSMGVAARVVGVALIVVAIAWPVATVWPVRNDTTQKGFASAVHSLCHLVGKRGAVVILQGSRLEDVLPQTLRSYCQIPVATASAEPDALFRTNRAELTALAQRWQRTRRTLFVIADGADRIDRVFPGLQPAATVNAVNNRLLRKTTGVRPHQLVTEKYRFVVAPVPTTTSG